MEAWTPEQRSEYFDGLTQPGAAGGAAMKGGVLGFEAEQGGEKGAGGDAGRRLFRDQFPQFRSEFPAEGKLGSGGRKVHPWRGSAARVGRRKHIVSGAPYEGTTHRVRHPGKSRARLLNEIHGQAST